MKAVKANVKFEEQNTQISLNVIQIVYFLQIRFFIEKKSYHGEYYPSFSAEGHYGLSVSLRG